MGITELLAHGGFGQQLGRCNQPADAQTRRQNLAETSAMRQPLAAARYLIAQGQQARWWGLVKVQLAIGVIFHHQGLGLGCHRQNSQAPLKAQRGTAGVAKSRYQVDQLGLVLLDQLFQLIHVDTVCVNRCVDQLCAIKAKALNGGQKGRRFHNHLVAR